MWRACSMTLMYRPKVKGVFDVKTLYDIIQMCDTLKDNLLYKSLFLLPFFGFFCISNLVPRTSIAFDATRNLARGDVILAKPGLQVLLKWSKTLQTCNVFKTVPLGTIPNSILCPVSTISAYIQSYPVSSNYPMFYIVNFGGNRVIIGEKHVRVALANILQRQH